MQQILVGISSLILLVAAAKPSGAQEAASAGAPSAACVPVIAEYFGCLSYGDLPEAQARTVRGYPRAAEEPPAPKAAAASASAAQAMPQTENRGRLRR
jgi:hypothetical protein